MSRFVNHRFGRKYAAKFQNAFRMTPKQRQATDHWYSLAIEPLETRTLLSTSLSGIPNWIDQGPGPMINAQLNVPPNNPAAGAIHSVAVHPNQPTHMIIGTVAGGVWRTTNANAAAPAGVTWTPIGDNLGTLSIGAITYDTADATGNTFYAGAGDFSNSFDGAGRQTGVYRTTDAGANWELLGTDTPGGNPLVGLQTKSIVVIGNTILVSGVNPFVGSRDYRVLGGALFRSIDGGDIFTQEVGAGATDLPNGAVPSLVQDPNAANTVYAAIPGQGVYWSTDTGNNWTQVNTGLGLAGTESAIELAVEDNGATTTIYAGVATGGTLNGVFSTANAGANWNALPGALPAQFNAGPNFAEKVQLIVDPDDAGVVYIAGQGGVPAGDAYRYNPGGGGSWTSIFGANANNTTPHVDSHDMRFFGDDTLLYASDGGLYFLNNPHNIGANTWQSFNGVAPNGIRAVEFFAVAYDPNGNRIMGGSQDNGGEIQTGLNNQTWDHVQDGDGQNQEYDAVNNIRYGLGNNFGNFDRNGTQLQLRATAAGSNFDGLQASDRPVAGGFNFFQAHVPFILNAVDPTRILIGRNGLYESDPAAILPTGNVIDDITPAGMNQAQAVAYGGRRAGMNFVNVALVGTTTGQLFFRGEAGAAFTNVSGSLGGAGAVEDIVLDPQDWRRVYVLRGDQTFVSNNITDLTNNPFNPATSNLGALTNDVRSIELFDTTPGASGDSILLAGGLGGVYRWIAGVWNKFGQMLPNILVQDVRFSTDDVDGNVANGIGRLIAGTMGRGAWTIDNVSQSIDDSGVLTIFGDDDFINQDDVIRLVRRPENTDRLEVIVNGASEGIFDIEAIQQINVFGLGGNDTLIMDSTNGLINVSNGTRYDGNVGFDQLQLLQTGGPTHTSDNYSVGPNIGAGTSVIVGAGTAGTQMVFFENLSPVIDLVPAALLTVNATATNNAINYSLGSLLTNGTITIDEHESIEFSNKTSLVINAGAGADTVGVNNASTPTSLTSITINGGDPGIGDSLQIIGVGAAVTVNTSTSLISGATGSGGAVPISFSTLESIALSNVAALTLTSNGADDTLVVTPGLTPAGINNGLLTSSGAVAEVSFANSGSLTANLGGGDDSLVVNGSSNNDTVAVSGAAVTITGRHGVTYSGAESLRVNGRAGSDTFNVTPSASVEIFIDGGDPVGTLPGDLLNIIAGGGSVTYTAGPQTDEGSFDVGANQTVSFDRIESFSISGSGPAVINGTNGPDAITVIARDSSTHGAANGVQDFTVSVNNGPELLFVNVASLTINALSGSDQTTLQTPAPNNAVWDVDVLADGGPPAGDTDRLIVQTPGAGAETAVYTPGAADGGMFDLTSLSSLVTISTTEQLTYDGQTDDDNLTIVGTSLRDRIVHTPGANDQAGSFSVNSLLVLSYQNLGSGASLTVDGGALSDNLVVNGTAANDSFTVGAAGQTNLNSRLALNEVAVECLTLEGFDGDDVFTLVPAISASVYTKLHLNGGGQASASGDRANLIATAGADNLDVSGQTVSLSGKTVKGNGIEDIRLDALAGDDLLTYSGVSGITENITVSSSGVAGGGQVSVPGVTLVGYGGVERIDVLGNAPTLTETDTLTVAGTNLADVMQINLAAAGTDSAPILKLQQSAVTLLTLRNYTNFSTLRVLTLDGEDTINVRVAASGPSRNLFVDGGIPSGKRKSTDKLNVIYGIPRPKIIHSAATQDPDAGLVDLTYPTARFLVQYDEIEEVVIRRA